jgi:hypothetical protein
MTVEVTFSVSGYVKQRVKLKDGYTPAQLQADLNAGRAWTTIQHDGDVVLLTETETDTVGKVISVDNNCEYEDFTVEPE